MNKRYGAMLIVSTAALGILAVFAGLSASAGAAPLTAQQGVETPATGTEGYDEYDDPFGGTPPPPTVTGAPDPIPAEDPDRTVTSAESNDLVTAVPDVSVRSVEAPVKTGGTSGQVRLAAGGLFFLAGLLTVMAIGYWRHTRPSRMRTA